VTPYQYPCGFARNCKPVFFADCQPSVNADIADSYGRVRLEHPSAFQQTGMAMVGDIDGQRVMVWSGGAASSYLPEGKK
jgi:hypothetical protein